MTKWQLWVLCTVLCWGAYIPILHHAQAILGVGKSALRTFLFVGLAYFITSGVILLLVVTRNLEPWEFKTSASGYAFLAGVLGAVGALGIVFAMRSGGAPTSVVPLVFAGAPIVGTLVGFLLHKPSSTPNPLFFVGILLAAAGASMVLAYRPS